MRDDEDGKMFVRTLGDAAEKAGFRIHAYVLMTNRREFLGLLEKRVDWRKPVEVETSVPAGEGWLDFAVFGFAERVAVWTPKVPRNDALVPKRTPNMPLAARSQVVVFLHEPHRAASSPIAFRP